MKSKFLSFGKMSFSLIMALMFLFTLSFQFVSCSSDDDSNDSVTNTKTDTETKDNDNNNNGETTDDTKKSDDSEKTDDTKSSDESKKTEDNTETSTNSGKMIMSFDNVASFDSGATADEITTKILSLTSDTTIKLNGAINAVTLKKIVEAMKENDSIQIALDLYDTTGIVEWKDWFAEVTTLYSISLPKTVTTIAEPDNTSKRVFADCTKLQAVTIPPSIQKYYRILPSNLDSVYVNFAGDLSDWLKSSITLWNEREKLYLNGAKITKVIIPDTITDIRANAFKGWSELTSVTIPSSVTNIGDGAFNGCTALNEVIIADGSSTLTLGCNFFDMGGNDGRGLFYDCPLEKVYLGRNFDYSSYTEYKDGKVYKTYSCEENAYSFYKKSGYSAFYGKGSLVSLEIGNNVTNIGSYAFYSCNGLTSITIGDSVTNIGDYAFSYCFNLEKVIIPVSVKTIGREAFYFLSSKKVKVYYRGSSEQWNLITIRSDNYLWVSKYNYTGE